MLAVTLNVNWQAGLDTGCATDVADFLPLQGNFSVLFPSELSVRG
jgi:hypothetical protein